IGGRGAGGVNAALTLSAGTVRVNALAPTVKAKVDLAIGLEDPYPFDGHATLEDDDIEALLAIAGLATDNPGPVRGRISSAIACTGDLRDLASTAMTLEVAPIDITVFDVPIAASRGLRAGMTGRHVQLEQVTMKVGGLAVSVGGTVATDRSDATLLLDVDGDFTPLAPL